MFTVPCFVPRAPTGWLLSHSGIIPPLSLLVFSFQMPRDHSICSTFQTWNELFQQEVLMLTSEKCHLEATTIWVPQVLNATGCHCSTCQSVSHASILISPVPMKGNCSVALWSLYLSLFAYTELSS